MAKKESKGGGARKYGRNKRRTTDTIMSAFVKGRISGESYFKQKGLTTHFNYIKSATPKGK